MKSLITYSILISAAFVLLMSCNQKTDGKQEENEFLFVSGAYVGEQPPEKVPRLFAPGVISTGLNERDAAFSGKGKDLFFTRFTDDKYVIMYTYEEDDRWIEPEVASFSGEYNDMEPCFARWSKGLYFISNRPVEGVEKGEYDFDIWYTYKSMAGWSEPQNIGAPVNTNNVEAYPSVTRDGTLYFVRNDSAMTRSDIYRARFDIGRFKEPEKLPEI
ncbi:MAG: PD40 domain-containing protein, partial [Bacteroidales bacterium]|nr:PD40 domain-containing protein [Bacteroidales bacterium]